MKEFSSFRPFCKINYVFVIFCCILSSISAQTFVNLQPEQVHLSLGSSPTQMIVTWVTPDPTVNTDFVEYGTNPGSYQFQAIGRSTRFVDGGPLQSVRYIHRAKMHVTPGQRYFYHVGSADGWSNMFYFTAQRTDTNAPYKICLLGDLGLVNGVSLGRLQRETQRGAYDLVIDLGDIAYDMDTDNGKWGDQFFRNIEPIAAYVPFMVVAGNHEETHNFSHYVNRFTMPGSLDNQYYSFDFGPVHFIALSTEYYGYIEKYGTANILSQFAWLGTDLNSAVANRKNVPWIVPYYHRPFYCSNKKSKDCSDSTDSLIRKGGDGIPGLEEIFKTHAVDVCFSGHEHGYERMWPVYNLQTYKNDPDPYHNAPVPIYLVSGSAGNSGGHTNFVTPYPWSAVRENIFGYTILTAYNGTFMHMQQISTESNGAVIDDIWISKTAQFDDQVLPQKTRSERHL